MEHQKKVTKVLTTLLLKKKLTSEACVFNYMWSIYSWRRLYAFTIYSTPEEFYNDIQAVINQLYKYDQIIIVGGLGIREDSPPIHYNVLDKYGNMQRSSAWKFCIFKPIHKKWNNNYIICMLL